MGIVEHRVFNFSIRGKIYGLNFGLAHIMCYSTAILWIIISFPAVLRFLGNVTHPTNNQTKF